MNIRSVSNPVIPIDIRGTGETKNVKMDQSHQDRDADGRHEEKEPDKSPLDEEEFKRATEYFDSLASLKASGLEVSVEESDSQIRMFIIRDQDGQVVRRIPEYELRHLNTDKDKRTGQILDRAG